MFELFLQQGSITSVVLMTYAGNVMMEAFRVDRFYKSPPLFTLHRIITNPLARLFMLASVPCAIWPSIYIGLYTGILAGVISWLALLIVGAIATSILRVGGLLIGIHFILACIAFPIGYYLSLTNLP